MATATIALTAPIQHNQGGHPFVEICEESPAFSILRATPGKYANGSSSSALSFAAPVLVLVNGVARTVTGVGAIYHETTTTRERNPRNGKIRETTVKGPACCYAYLNESPVSRGTQLDYNGQRSEESGREQWEQNPAGSASDNARREDY